ncbi:hypothetical protein AX17_002494 [Amanita inopinata Kibby_2008]|nr:hypothetical protein AX17_002494 [Amanita inopinata Kibby_2008]
MESTETTTSPRLAPCANPSFPLLSSLDMEEVSAAVQDNGTNVKELSSTLETVLSPVTLPCGRTLANRLVKVALYEHLTLLLGGPPNQHHINLYERWGRSGWGMILTGNVQVAKTHLSLGRDVIVPEDLTEESIEPFKRFASAIHGLAQNPGTAEDTHDASQPRQKPLAMMQLSHAGRQSCNFIGGRRVGQSPLAPSSVRVTSKNKGALSSLTHRVLFQTPKEMTLEDIDDVVERFVRGATLAHKSGFDGVQLHAAHGYLLAQFISPKTNHRQDTFSSDADNALRLLQRIVDEIREAVPKDFVLGVKINSADYVDSNTPEDDASSEERVTQHVLSIARWGKVDFIEISGGDYESPDFMAAGGKSRRQAFFAHFSQHIVKSLDSSPSDSARPLITLTGGLRTPSLLCDVVSSGHADLLGIGRGSILRPDLPLYLRQVLETSKSIDDAEVWDSPFEREPDLEYPAFLRRRSLSWLWRRLPRIPLIGAGVQMAWYGVQMRRLGASQAEALKLDYNLGSFRAVTKLWFWVSKEPVASHGSV